MVSESSAVGDYVAHVNVRDMDSGVNGQVQLILHGDDAPFEIVSVGTRGYAIQVSGPLDREQQDTWRVWLEARDSGSPNSVSYQVLLLGKVIIT